MFTYDHSSRSATVDVSLGERELEVLAALWRNGPGTVAEVRERLSATLAYNTVLTILRNLEAKNVIEHTAEGRTFRYHAVVTEQAVRGSALSRLVHQLFRGSALRVVAQLVEQESLSPEELRDLHRLVDARLADAAHAPPDAPASSALTDSESEGTPRRRS
jgi:BlaI family penicillinase repressor